MDGINTAVLDAPETVDASSTPEPTGQPEAQKTETPEAGAEKISSVDPYSLKASKAYNEALKAWTTEKPEMAKFARMAKDDHSRLYQLHQLEPKGLNGVRETYAVMNGLQHGEAKGLQALSAIQDEVRAISDTDARLAAGDPAVLDAFGDEFNGGLAKLAPHILDRIRSTAPDAYAEAIFPHLMTALLGGEGGQPSELVQYLDGMIGVLNEQPPRWLTENQKIQWTEDKMQRIIQSAAGMSTWFQAQQHKLQNAGKEKPVAEGGDKGKEDWQKEREAFEKQRQEEHWKKAIAPQTAKYSDTRFNDLFKPYAHRLKLQTTTVNALKRDFVDRVVKQATQRGPNGEPSEYMKQIARYRSQRNPDPKAVVNLFKVEFDKYAEGSFKELVKERYGGYLSGKQKPVTPTNTARPVAAPAKAPGIQVVSTRPTENQIDHRRRTTIQIHQDIFPLKNGKVVRYVKQ